MDASAGDSLAGRRVHAARAARRRPLARPRLAPRRSRVAALGVAGQVRSARTPARAAPDGARRRRRLRGRPGGDRLVAARGAASGRRARGPHAGAGGSDSRPRARARAAARRRRQRVSDRGRNLAVLSPGGVVAVVAHSRRARALLRRHRARRERRSVRLRRGARRARELAREQSAAGHGGDGRPAARARGARARAATAAGADRGGDDRAPGCGVRARRGGAAVSRGPSAGGGAGRRGRVRLVAAGVADAVRSSVGTADDPRLHRARSGALRVSTPDLTHRRRTGLARYRRLRADDDARSRTRGGRNAGAGP